MIVTARKLARSSPRRPRQAELKRAVSTAYYALFQAMAKAIEDLRATARRDRKAFAVHLLHKKRR